MLQDFRHSNEQLLLQTEVNLSLYGKYDVSGVKDGEPEPCPRTWDPERKTWNDTWKESLYDFEIKYLQKEYENMDVRCGEKLPSPQRLMDIVDLGINTPHLATCAFAEILEQLYNSDSF